MRIILDIYEDNSIVRVRGISEGMDDCHSEQPLVPDTVARYGEPYIHNARICGIVAVTEKMLSQKKGPTS
jgi:hypothetical protein